VRILTYHRVVADDQDPFAVSPGDFVRQMETLAQTARVVDLGTALSGLGAGDGSASRIVVSFDDGTRDFMTEAAPVLSRLGLPSVIYVNPSRVGEPGFLGWDDLLELSRAGVEVGSHSLEHRSLGSLTQGEVRRQVVESRRALEDRLGLEVSALAYPYGTVRDFNEWIKAEVSTAGYRSACTAINGVNGPGADPMALRRTKIEQGDLPIFSWILEGALDGWAFIDKHLSLVQNRYV
jgi:peptidoglycan/xylan/chitin deacetylase (PgdA/CDA1 family)